MILFEKDFSSRMELTRERNSVKARQSQPDTICSRKHSLPLQTIIFILFIIYLFVSLESPEIRPHVSTNTHSFNF